MGRADAGVITIIALTANVFEEDVNAYPAPGMDAHIARPADYQTLAEVIGRHIQGRRQEPRGRSQRRTYS